jgi:hypothetical protein
VAAAWGCRILYDNYIRGQLPTELGMLTRLTSLCVHRPHSLRLDACTVTGPGCGLSATAMWGCRSLGDNGFTGTLPTELGTMDALYDLCVRHPHSLRLDACAVTGLWAECGGVGVQGFRRPLPPNPQPYRGTAAHRAGHHGRAELPVRAPPSPAASGRVHRHRVV